MRATIPFFGRCAALVFLAVAVLPARAEPAGYWVWQRGPYLSTDEAEALNRAHVPRLYWQIGTLGRKDSSWPWKEQYSQPWNEPLSSEFSKVSKAIPGIQIIPVIRIEPPPDWSFNPGDNEALITRLNAVAAGTGAPELQIDYEAPDRLIPSYAAFLQQLHPKRKWQLSITALGHWDRFASSFQGAVDEITPMFYDLDPAHEQLRGGLLGPLGDPSSTHAQLERWRHCPIPWRAGLPNFSRVTFVGTDGWSRGNLRNWRWDEVWFSPLLAPNGPTKAGQTSFTVRENGVIGDAPVHRGETVVVREPDRPGLRDLVDSAAGLGATGAIYFRLANFDASSGFTVTSLNSASSTPFKVHWETKSAISLVVEGDVPPRIFSNGQRGYALALRCAGEGWREAFAGTFHHVTTDATGLHPAHDPLPIGTNTLYFWFAQIQEGSALVTGLVRTGGTKSFQWQLVNLDSENTWHSVN